MRDKVTNDRLFKKIRADLRCWEAGAAPPTTARIVLATVVLLSGGYWLLSQILNNAVFIPLVLIWVSVNIGMAFLFIRRYGKSWAQEVDHKLAQYQPADQMAWEELKQCVSEGGVSFHVVQLWFDTEARALTLAAEQKWEMLQNKHGAQCTTTPEQPVKPDTKEV